MPKTSKTIMHAVRLTRAEDDALMPKLLKAGKSFSDHARASLGLAPLKRGRPAKKPTT